MVACGDEGRRSLPRSADRPGADAPLEARVIGETPGTKLHRTTYHYWFHLGESQAVRQLLGPTKKLPDFVGGFRTSQYRPER